MDELVIPLYALRSKRKGYEVSVMKAMMDELGFVGGNVRPPLVDVREEVVDGGGHAPELSAFRIDAQRKDFVIALHRHVNDAATG